MITFSIVSRRQRRRVWLLTALSLAGVPVAGRTAQATEYHVSPTGEDGYPGTAEQPFRTIRHASRVMRAGDGCVLHAGTYRETIVPPSGTESEPVLFRAGQGETVTISGCDPVQGWQHHAGRIYKAPWHGALGSGSQVFVGRRMAFQARWPNNPAGSLTLPPLATAAPGSDRANIICPQLPPVDLTGAGVWFVAGTRWEAQASRVTRSAARSIGFADPGYDAIACRPGASFYVFGVLPLLDQENEWVVDGGQVYLWAPGGVDPSSLPVEAKTRYFGIDLAGKQHVQVRGINLFGCSVRTDSATADVLIDGITAEYAGHWEPCGDELDPPREQRVAMDLAGRAIALRNSTIRGAAGTLVALTGSDSRIVNCLIHDAGYAGRNSECVGVYGTRQLLAHNTIHTCGRSVIGYGASRSRVAYNNVSRAGLLTWDVGLLTTGNTDGGDSEIDHNWFHDNLSGGLARGIFLSTGAHNFLIHHNVVWNCWEGGFHGEPPLEYVQLLNNTFVTTPEGGDAGGVDISSFTYGDDQVGGVVANNVFTDDIRTLGHDVALAGNLLRGTDPRFVAPAALDFRLAPASPGVGRGRAIPGITRGSRPDVGAYEGDPWRPGHDFARPPEARLSFSDSPFWNRVQNSGFERGLPPWTPTGAAAGVARQPLNADPTSNTDGLVHSGRWGLRLSGGECGVQQVTSPLAPHTTYVLTAWAKLTSPRSAAVLSVTGSFGTQSIPFGGPGQAVGTWLRRSIAVTTGATPEALTAHVGKTSAVAGDDVLVDDVGLAQSLSPAPLLTVARADCDRHRGAGLNQFELLGHWHGSRSWTKDDRAQVRFHGRQVVLYAQVREDGGMLGVAIDDGPETVVDCFYPQLPHHATVQPTVPLYRSPQLAKGAHTLKLRVVGAKNPASRGTTVHIRYADVLD